MGTGPEQGSKGVSQRERVDQPAMGSASEIAGQSAEGEAGGTMSHGEYLRKRDAVFITFLVASLKGELGLDGERAVDFSRRVFERAGEEWDGIVPQDTGESLATVQIAKGKLSQQ